MNSFAAFLITLYQKYLSPHKGFCCAHAALYGGDSCSQAVKMIILEQGLFGGYQNSRHRFKSCKKAHQDLKKKRKRDKCLDYLDCSGVDCSEVRHLKKCSELDFPDVSCDLPCDVPCDCSF